VSPTALAEAPAAPLDITSAPAAGEGTDLTGAAAGGQAFEVPELPEVESAPPAELPVAEPPADLDALLGGAESAPEPVVSAPPPEDEVEEASAEAEGVVAEEELQSSGEEPPADQAVLLQAEDIEEV